MDLERLGPEGHKAVQEILGYLNYSSGTPDPRFLGSLNRLAGLIAALPAPRRGSPRRPTWQLLSETIGQGMATLRDSSEAFRHMEQAEAVLRLVFAEVLPAYRKFHRDLLYHQTDETLFQPLFIGRVCEAVLAEGGPWEDTERIVQGALKRLNDFLGHRPVAVLRSAQKLQPYPQEWVRPIPLYIAGAGVGVGVYQELVEKALAILRATEPMLLHQAWFDPEVLDELGLDPRAFDFEHPVNRRPNYHFGGWDPHQIDLQGRYRRFVVQEVTLKALLSRVDERRDLPRDEVLFEAAAVMAGTMLMGAGVSGSGPESHDSSVTLAKLLPHIAAYRDAFYERLLEQLPADHAERLRAEAVQLRQPFGGARQHLNQTLARRRAEQMQHVHLALLFARMGYTEAAERQVAVVPVASARMRTEMHCRLTAGHLLADRGRLEEAAQRLPEVEDLLHRAIHCGALVDPWNILGFGGQFPLFPAVENSIYDHRVDELIELISEIFGLYARLEKAAAATGQTALRQRLSDQLAALAAWWDKFATTEVSGVESISGHQMWESAAQVSTALAAWHEAGTAAGDIGFWRQYVERFNSPKAFALLVEALLDQGDRVAAMSLLTYWLSRADEISLAEGDYSFHTLAVRWMEQLWGREDESRPGNTPPQSLEERWTQARKFLDYLEANGETYWQVPSLELARQPSPAPNAEPSEDEEDDLFGAAYENVTYRDTTDDGFEGEMLEWGEQPTDFELTAEADRLGDRLVFLRTVARLWKLVATAITAEGVAATHREPLGGWLNQAVQNRVQLAELLNEVHRYHIPRPRSTHESLVEYAQRQGVKEALLDRVILTSVEMADAARFLWGAVAQDEVPEGWAPWELPAQRVLQAASRADAQAVCDDWDELLEILRGQPLLYIPTSKGGSPHRVVASRNLQRVLHRLLAATGRLGLLAQTYQLIGTIQEMERRHPVGPGAFTEFDRLFETGCRAIVQCLVASSEDWSAPTRTRRTRGRRSEADLIEVLERAVEQLLARWLNHSRNIRLSVLETVSEDNRWRELKRFIERYGSDLFTQRFMNFGNLRAILHQGAENYLRALQEDEDEERPRLVEELGVKIPLETAASLLELCLEAVLENYSEYVDYNSTTTQSDRGEMLYTLLDFLRLEASYDRVAWNLKPVVLAHDVLVRAGRGEAADRWRQAVIRRTGGVAAQHLKRFTQLCQKYGMRLPSIADRLGERFVRPLDVDRLCARVRPAIQELRGEGPSASFAQLEREVAQFTQEPSGVGFDVPPWLEALEDEVQQVRLRTSDEDDPWDMLGHVPQAKLSVKELEQQMDEWE